MDHRRALLRLALPNYTALLSGVVAGIIDVAWVAGLGPDAVAAVAVTTNVENFLLGVVMLVSGGLTVTLSGRLGAGDGSGARAAVRSGWALFGIIAGVVAVAGWALRVPLAGMFLDDARAAHLAVTYFAVSMPTVVLFYAGQMVDAIFAGHGDTRTPMRLALLSNVVLLMLDPLLIYGLDWGVVGAAVATAAGRLVAVGVGLLLLRRLPLRGGYGPLWSSAHGIVATGLPISGDFLIRMAGALALVAVVGRFGVVALAAYGIGIKALYFATMCFYAIRNAATIHTPRTLAVDPAALPMITRQVLRLGLAAGLIAAVIAFAAAPWIMRAFTTDPSVVGVGVDFLRWVGLYLVPVAGVIGLAGLLMASGRGSRLFGVTAAGMAFQSLLAVTLSGPLGLTGVWIAMALGACAQFCVVLALALGRRPVSRGAAFRGRDPEAEVEAQGGRREVSAGWTAT
jgi:putative MATE family efflux protein